MKRFLILMMTIVSSVAAAEAKGSTRVERSVQATYYGPHLTYEYRSCTPLGAAGCFTLQTGANEGFLTAKITDAHGQAVSVWVVDTSEPKTDLNGSGNYGVFCGETTEPISFPAGSKLEFWIGGDWWPDEWSDPWWMVPQGWNCLPGAGTTGTMSITLSNVP